MDRRVGLLLLLVGPILGQAVVVKTVVQGQGLSICEDAQRPCQISFKLPSGGSWTPPNMGRNSKCPCGVELLNIPVQWTGRMVSLGSSSSAVKYKLNVVPLVHNATQVITIQEGDSAEVKCSFPPEYKLLNCRTHWASFDEWFSWCPSRFIGSQETVTCRASVMGSLDQLETVIKVVVEPREGDATELGKKSFRCEASMGEIESCSAENLNTRTMINLEDHLRSQTFSAANTRLKNGICEMEAVSSDVISGTWRFYMKMKSLNKTPYDYEGCIFNPPRSNANELIEKYRRQLSQPKTMPASENLRLSCPIAPYPLTRCSLRDPDNNVIHPPEELFKRTSKVGICMFPEVDVSKGGEWVCSINSVDETEDWKQRYIFEGPRHGVNTIIK